MDAHRKRILELAEQGDWDDVLELVEMNPTLAKAQDDFGMLPLHWACTEPSIPLDTVKTLLAAFPEACQLENLSGMAPLHVAVSSKMPGLAINLLLQAYPEAAFMKDGSGRYPIELAMESNLPKYTIDLIRKAGARAVRSNSSVHAQRSASFDDLNSMISSRSSSQSSENFEKAELLKARSIGSLMASRQASEYARLLDEKLPSLATPIGPIESTEISLQLKELLVQLQQLSADIRTNSSTSGSTYRSSFSSSSSESRHNSPSVNTVLWNPSDKLGFSMEPVRDDVGARINKLGSKSSVLGAETLTVGDVLVSINGTSVIGSSYSTIARFLKHSKVACKLCFSKGGSLADFSTSSSNSMNIFTPSHSQANANDQDSNTILYAKVAEMLDATLKKVSAVEETVRLSSAMSFCA